MAVTRLNAFFTPTQVPRTPKRALNIPNSTMLLVLQGSFIFFIDKKRIKDLLDNSLMLITALAPKIGYDKAARIAKEAHKNGTTLKTEVIKAGLISEKEYEKIMSPIKMTKPK